MNKVLKYEFKRLEQFPAISAEDIEELKMILSGFHLEKREYHIIGVYKNLTYVALNLNYTDLLYYIWYNKKYRKNRFLYLEDFGLLDYGLTDKEKYEALIARASIEKRDCINLNLVVNATKEM